MKKTRLSLLIGIVSLNLIGCSYFGGFGKDNSPEPTPLVNFTPSMTIKPVWSAHPGNGSAKMQLTLPLAVLQGVVYVSNYNGVVAAYSVDSGKHLWSTNAKAHLTSGPGVGANIVAVGSDNGEIIALDKNSGQVVWRRTLSGQILAVPQVSGNQVVVKTIDGYVYSLNITNGDIIWQYARSASQYMLRASSAPGITNDTVIAGFNDGKLLALKLSTGQLLWERTIAMPQGASLVQQLIDLDTNPLVVNNTIYVAGYQGSLLSMSLDGNQLLWQRPFSTYHNLALAGDLLFAVDTDSQIWALDSHSGKVRWKQTELLARRLTGGAIQEQALVVGDMQGYLHWLAIDDGHLLARVKVGSDAILATPVVVGDILITISKSGAINAFRRV
jgi:outer membrane protein assembly factor BamB